MNKTETRTGPGNVTSRWLEARLQSGLYKKFLAALATQFKSSLDASLVPDHIQTFLTNLIQRDALRERIEIQRPIFDSQLCLWLRRSATNDIRAMGRNPVCRVLFHARTEAEETEGFYKQAPNTFRMVFHNADAPHRRIISPDSIQWHLVDPNALDPEQTLLGRDWLLKLQKQLRDVLRQGGAQQATKTRHLDICDRLLSGQGAGEIAEDLQMTSAQINTAITSIRRRFKRALKNKILRLE